MKKNFIWNLKWETTWIRGYSIHFCILYPRIQVKKGKLTWIRGYGKKTHFFFLKKPPKMTKKMQKNTLFFEKRPKNTKKNAKNTLFFEKNPQKLMKIR